ncbi:Structural maintenance of chromosomes protein 5 [Coemansia erecta]|uniref:Structural maintenance of chromosomes protein 5 n=1 Tax=Coemansia asiatica TaxID=1052880 RepID=A0A9W8CG61_9FUNG|nr:Structural maintenance of chromosomes protein 5 [Coemansia asiatica]KAJ2857098.1 Structural maintenance of chromosomes protein 5 [Coemansia erecta]
MSKKPNGLDSKLRAVNLGSSRKRALESDEESGSESEENYKNIKSTRMSVSKGTKEGYKPGSIKHISLRNFVTYDSIEVSPGPNMNMIIGPNGTGKSTIVCAIALGLGEKPAILGRAKDLSEFVKHGHAQGHVEITLAGPAHMADSDVKIRREIYRESNKSIWFVNDRQTTAAEVIRVTKELNVQVGSLCQFLPQDRVVEFSKMSPQDLLRETVMAVGRDDLIELQKKLVEKRQKERKMIEDEKRLLLEAQTLKKKNEVLERDVQRWQERQQAESQLRVLTALVPVARYTQAKARHDQAKEERRKAHVHYQEVRNATGPAEAEILELETRVAASENQRRQLADRRVLLEREARKQLTKCERLESAQRDLNSEMDALKRRAQKRKETIAALRSEIARLEAEFGEIPRPPDAEPEEMLQEIADLRSRKLEMNNEIIQIQEEQNGLSRSGTRINADIGSRTAQMRDLDDVVVQRREALRRFNEDTFKALEWLEANRSMFSQHVFAPVCLEASVRDSRFAAIIESVVGMSTLRTFVVQCDEDYHKFARNVIDTMKLRVDVVSLRKTLDDFHPPLPQSRLSSLGFDGYALDFIDAPRPVLAAMCDRDRIHETPVALGSVDNQAIESQNLFKEYVADGTKYSITRGRYGSRASTVTTMRTRPQARLLSAGETDESRAQRERLTREIDELRNQLGENEKTMRKLGMRERKVRDSHRQIEFRESELRKERENRTEAMRVFNRAQVRIESKQAQLDSLVSEERKEAQGGQTLVQQERKRIESELRENAQSRTQAIADVAQAVSEIATVLHDAASTGLQGLCNARALNSLREEADRQRRAVDEAREAFERANLAFGEAKEHAKMCLEETRSVTDGMTDDERQAVRDAQEQRREVTCEELEIELSTCRQRLSMAANSGLSARVMEQYAERKAQLENVETECERIVVGLRSVRNQKRSLRRKWEGPLNQIIQEISENFTRMFDHIGCSGEVRLKRVGDGVVSVPDTTATADMDPEHDENNDGDNSQQEPPRDDEDYGSWGIEIRVSFRSNEDLQALDNHRQSGGERAVSTIVYLQSLQSLVAAPFRVVDEINQGMDQRNERLIHALIVNTACQPDVGQYFLITPKLLQDLEYHPMMKILCIFNGEWQPEAFNFSKYISNARSTAVR